MKYEDKQRHKFNVDSFNKTNEVLKNIPKQKHALGSENNPLILSEGYYKQFKKANMIDKDAWNYCIIQGFYYKKDGFSGYPKK